MCRNTSDRRILIAALKRIARPPESISGETGWANAKTSDAMETAMVFYDTKSTYKSYVAEKVLKEIGVNIT